MSLSAAALAPLLMVATSRLLQNRLLCPANEHDFQSELSQRIPVGSGLSDARRLLEQNGFRCDVAPDSMLWQRQIRLGAPASPPAAPSLFARKIVKPFPIFGNEKTWHVKASFSRDKITRIEGGFGISFWD